MMRIATLANSSSVAGHAQLDDVNMFPMTCAHVLVAEAV